MQKKKIQSIAKEVIQLEINALKKLRDLGNTVIVVEHDTETMENADYIVDLGPEAGNKGGEIVAHGTFKEISQNNNSITGKYLSKKLRINIPNQRRIAKNGRFVEISGAVKRPATYELLKNETVENLVDFALGFTNTANKTNISLSYIDLEANATVKKTVDNLEESLKNVFDVDVFR